MKAHTLLTTMILGAVASFACGAGPTSPTAVTTSARPSSASDPSPGPAPAPTPTPTPTPAPTPTPTPTPTPAPPTPPAPAPPGPADVWKGSATTDQAFWFGKAALPASFDVVLTPDRMTLGPLSGTVLIWSDRGNTLSVFGRPDGSNVQFLFDWTTGKGTWTFNGLPGNASGTVTLSR